MNKKEIRKAFRDTCFKRDNYTCVICKCQYHPEETLYNLDCHHISDRKIMPNGGYVKENGISLCRECHIKAEMFHSTGTSYPDYSPDDLYLKINSSFIKAIEASRKL